MRRGITIEALKTRHREYMQRYRTLMCADCKRKGTRLCRECAMMRIAERLAKHRSISRHSVLIGCGSVECRRDWIELNGDHFCM